MISTKVTNYFYPSETNCRRIEQRKFWRNLKGVEISKKSLQALSLNHSA
jgi:hypothetical protein